MKGVNAMNFKKFLNIPVIDQVNNLLHKTPKQMFDLGTRFVGYYLIGWVAIALCIIGFLGFIAWVIHATIPIFIAGLLILLILPLINKKGGN